MFVTGSVSPGGKGSACYVSDLKMLAGCGDEGKKKEVKSPSVYEAIHCGLWGEDTVQKSNI